MNLITKNFQLAFDAILNRDAGSMAGNHETTPSGLARWVAQIKRRRMINRNIRELSGLSNEMLKDIGIERGNIHAVVVEVIDSGDDRPPAGIKPIGVEPATVGTEESVYRMAKGATA